jgi:RNA polymerase sigma-70 factor (ECF subfamily)
MNASAMETGTPGDDAAHVCPESMPGCWLASADGPDDEAWRDFADPVAAGPTAPGSALARQVTDEQLQAWIDALVDQDERALAALYDATFPRVFGIVRRIVGRAALAEEVVEDTYFQVWRQAARFDPARGRALTWLLSIARSRAIDALRHEARFRHESLDEQAERDTADLAPPCDELLDLARHQAELHQALVRLGAQPRQLVSLAFFRGLSHEEIAQQTCLPLGTVKSQIRRALQTLRQILGEGVPAVLAPWRQPGASRS